MSVLDLGKAQRIVRPALPRPVETVIPKPRITPEFVAEVAKRAKAMNILPMPTPIKDARSHYLVLEWFNRVMGLGVEMFEVMSSSRKKNVVLAREAISVRMKFIGRVSYADIGRILRPNGCHSTIICSANRLLGVIFPGGKPDEEKISSVVRAMDDNQWREVLTLSRERTK